MLVLVWALAARLVHAAVVETGSDWQCPAVTDVSFAPHPANSQSGWGALNSQGGWARIPTRGQGYALSRRRGRDGGRGTWADPSEGQALPRVVSRRGSPGEWGTPTQRIEEAPLFARPSRGNKIPPGFRPKGSKGL